MKTITFYSYKGGVGRSLALANIATRLSEFNKKVCMIDFDLEAPGLPFKFNQSANASFAKGLVDYIYEFLCLGNLPKSIKEYSFSFNIEKNAVYLIPAGNTNSSDYWKKLSSINWFDLLYNNNQGLAFLLDLKRKIEKEFQPDFLLIDSRTGISEMSSIALSLLADEVVVLAANNKENLDGAKKIISAITNRENALFGKVPKVTFVLSRIPFTNIPSDKAKEQLLINKIKSDFLNLTDEINVLHSDRELEESEKIKIAYENSETNNRISKDYLNLFEKITVNELSPEEVTRFRNIREAERLFKKALLADEESKKLDFLDQSIELDAENIQYKYSRAITNIRIGKYDEAEKELETIIEVSPEYEFAYLAIGRIMEYKKLFANAIKFYHEVVNRFPKSAPFFLSLGRCYQMTNEIEKSISYYSTAIEIEPGNAATFNHRGNCYRLMGEYELALSDVYKSLELDIDSAVTYGTLAEINASLGNTDEFYLNIQRGLKVNSEAVGNGILKDDFYKPFFKEEKFIKLLEKYNIEIPVTNEEH